MDEIAERAGVSKPVLYQHFPGKLDLYLALLDPSCDTVIEGVRDALASTQDNAERVQATMACGTTTSPTRAAFRLVFESDLTSDPEVREQVDRVIEESAAAIAEVIVEDTGLSRAAADLLAVSLVGMGHVGARALARPARRPVARRRRHARVERSPGAGSAGSPERARRRRADARSELA